MHVQATGLTTQIKRQWTHDFSKVSFWGGCILYTLLSQWWSFSWEIAIFPQGKSTVKEPCYTIQPNLSQTLMIFYRILPGQHFLLPQHLNPESSTWTAHSQHPLQYLIKLIISLPHISVMCVCTAQILLQRNCYSDWKRKKTMINYKQICSADRVTVMQWYIQLCSCEHINTHTKLLTASTHINIHAYTLSLSLLFDHKIKERWWCYFITTYFTTYLSLITHKNTIN